MVSATPAAPRARRHLGQHFLRDAQVARRMVQALAPAAQDCVLEIGPGTGALTELLLADAPHLQAVEIDPRLVSLLRRRFAGSGLCVHEADILQCRLRDLLPAAAPQLRLVGNLPYNISTPLLFHLLSQKDAIRDMHFMLQAEVVARLAAPPGNKQYGRLTVMVGYHCQVQTLFGVPPEAFSPPPAVHSTVVRLRPDPATPRARDEALFARLVREAFRQRRKTLGNALRAVLPPAIFSQAGIDPRQRPEQLSVNDFISLSNAAAAPCERTGEGGDSLPKGEKCSTLPGGGGRQGCL